MNIYKWFLLFIIYSFIGWIAEIVCQLLNNKKYVNRGFLIGPYCPIYGFGSILMIILLQRYLNNPVLLFFMAVLICSLLEYFTSYIMEKLFKARWWDYSEKKFNLNGRISLDTMILFGLGGVIVLYFVNPFILGILNSWPSTVIKLLSVLIFIIYLLDTIISSKIIISFRNTTKKEARDNTDELTRKVKETLLKKSKLSRRLVKSFPNLKIK